jgi:hypothetical protein
MHGKNNRIFFILFANEKVNLHKRKIPPKFFTVLWNACAMLKIDLHIFISWKFVKFLGSKFSRSKNFNFRHFYTF